MADQDQENLMEASNSSNGMEDNNVDNSQQLFANNDNQPPNATNNDNQPPIATNDDNQPPIDTNNDNQPPIATNDDNQPPIATNNDNHPPIATNNDNQPPIATNNDNQPPIATNDDTLVNGVPKDNISKTSRDFHSIIAIPKELTNLTDDQTQVANKDGQTQVANKDDQTQVANKDGHLQITSTKDQTQMSVKDDQTQVANKDGHLQITSTKDQTQMSVKDDQTQVANKDGHLQITSTKDQTPMSVKDDQTLHTGGIRLDFFSDAEKSLMTTEHSNALSSNDQSEMTVNEDKFQMSSCGDQSQMDCINDQPLQMIKGDAKLNACGGVDTVEMNFSPVSGIDFQTQRTSHGDYSNAIISDKNVKELNTNDQLQAVFPEHKALNEESYGQMEISASNVSEMPNHIEQENGVVVESISAKSLESNESLQTVDLIVTIKQEPEDSGYEKRELIYRGGAIVVYSDTDSDSDSSFNVLSPAPVEEIEEEQEVPTNHDEVVEHQNERNKKSSKCISRTEGEVFPEELPPLEYLTISPDEGVELEPIGTVSGIVDVLVIVKANSNSPALYDDTVLFLEGRRPLGLIFETFGTVERPFYSVRFNNHRDILEQSISVGDRIYFAPKADNLTKYVFIAELRKVKFDDASWENDNEPPPTQIEYSDDEEEKRAKQRQKNKSRGSEGGMNGQTNGRKKKRKKPYMEERSESQGPQLLTGDLNRNPFGDRDKMYNPPPSNQWPPKEVPGCPPWQFQAQTNASFRRPPQAHFGESPDWKSQPNMGRTPTHHNVLYMGNSGTPTHHNVSYMGNSGSFVTNNNNLHGMMTPASNFSGSSYPVPSTNTYNSNNYNVPPHIALPGSNYFTPAATPQNYNFPQGNYPCFAQFNPSQPPPNLFSQMPPTLPPSSK